jgi:hypothetical protein
MLSQCSYKIHTSIVSITPLVVSTLVPVVGEVALTAVTPVTTPAATTAASILLITLPRLLATVQVLILQARTYDVMLG